MIKKIIDKLNCLIQGHVFHNGMSSERNRDGYLWYECSKCNTKFVVEYGMQVREIGIFGKTGLKYENEIIETKDLLNKNYEWLVRKPKC